MLKMKTAEHSLLVFEKIFGGTQNQGYATAKTLLSMGYQFSGKLMAIEIIRPDKTSVTLPLLFTYGAILSGFMGEPEKGLQAKKAHAALGTLLEEILTKAPSSTPVDLVLSLPSKANLISSIKAIKAIREVMGVSLKEAKDIVESARVTPTKIGTFVNKAAADSFVELFTSKFDEFEVQGAKWSYQLIKNDHATGELSDSWGEKTTPEKNVFPKTVFSLNWQKFPSPTVTPTSEVIKLKDALALGQPVRGSSASSVYYVVAVSKRVKVAARITANQDISLRAEWEGKLSPSDLAGMKALGMSLKPTYSSMHVASAGVSPARVIGAFLMDLGIEFDRQITNAKQLVVEK